MTTQRIDFAVVKEQASFSAILDRYGIKHRSSHGQDPKEDHTGLPRGREQPHEG